ncbi:hypothetical protein Bbelb_154460 [Branchiostoma belcheri]|nr:hypothetical protein Bbelb_154460 [Branchiostoma belcheri]
MIHDFHRPIQSVFTPKEHHPLVQIKRPRNTPKITQTSEGNVGPGALELACVGPGAEELACVGPGAEELACVGPGISLAPRLIIVRPADSHPSFGSQGPEAALCLPGGQTFGGAADSLASSRKRRCKAAGTSVCTGAGAVRHRRQVQDLPDPESVAGPTQAGDQPLTLRKAGRRARTGLRADRPSGGFSHSTGFVYSANRLRYRRKPGAKPR